MTAIGIPVFLIVGAICIIVFNNNRQGFFFFSLAAFIAAGVSSTIPSIGTISPALALIAIVLLVCAAVYKAKPEVFISYKSDDAEAVRHTVEVLIGNGLKVWFAEYEVLIKNYDNFDREIRRGISRSKAFVCFTSDAYVHSQYCRQEIEQFLGRSPTPDSIIEIRMAEDALPHKKYAILASCPSTRFQNEDQAAAFILGARKKTMTTSVPPACRIANTIRFPIGRDVFSMDISRWKFTPINRIDRDSDLFVGMFRAEVGEIELSGNLIVGTSVDSPRLWNPEIDDREAYMHAVDFARYFYHRRRWWQLLERPIGLHLVFNRGLSHSAITAKSWLWEWTRRYSLVIPLPKTGKVCEFTFLFFGKGSREQFYAVARFLDSLVSSLQFCASGTGE